MIGPTGSSRRLKGKLPWNHDPTMWVSLDQTEILKHLLCTKIRFLESPFSGTFCINWGEKKNGSMTFSRSLRFSVYMSIGRSRVEFFLFWSLFIYLFLFLFFFFRLSSVKIVLFICSFIQFAHTYCSTYNIHTSRGRYLSELLKHYVVLHCKNIPI